MLMWHQEFNEASVLGKLSRNLYQMTFTKFQPFFDGLPFYDLTIYMKWYLA